MQWSTQLSTNLILFIYVKMPTTLKLYQARLLHCQYNIHAWWSSATPCVAAAAAYIYLHAGLVSLTSTAAV